MTLDVDIHVVCCVDDDLALCGTDASNMVWSPDDETTCVVCADLTGLDTCPRGRSCPKPDTGTAWEEWEGMI